MCGRFTLRTPAKLLASWFQDVNFPVIAPRYNIAPTQQILALRSNPQHQIEACWLRWGLVPSWAADLKMGNQLINARSETASSKPAFRRAFKSRRCVILADGFFEWKQTANGKQPFLIQSTDTDRPLFCFAGLWERWQPSKITPAAQESASPAGSAREYVRQLELFTSPSEDKMAVEHISDNESKMVESCTILTTSANERMATLHDRMPVILDSRAQAIWLDQEIEDAVRLDTLLQPCPSTLLRIHAVSKQVNKPANDNANCVEPVSEDDQ